MRRTIRNRTHRTHGTSRGTRLGVPAAALCLLVASCTADRPATAPTPAPGTSESSRSAPPPSPAVSGPSDTVRPTDTGEPTETAGPTQPTGSPTTAPARFRAAAAMADVRLLAGRIGPRLATSPAFRRAGRVVERRFARLGYDVHRERFRVPAGDSWGVPVRAGRSFNVVAEPPGFDPAVRHVVVGAHLDTVAVAPGAEDNASGVAVLLEVARLAARHGTRLPVVLIAFGAEEPRGPGDDMHHFGSQHHVRGLAPPRRRALRAMVAIDRVGVGSVVPVCTGPLSPPPVRRALRRAAARVDVPTRRCASTASDHWSFEKAGFPVARLGSTSYAAYHSADDVPAVVNQAQLGRTGRVVWEWLR